MAKKLELRIGNTTVGPLIRDGLLHNIGSIRVGDTPLRGATRFLPWFDTYESQAFRSFRFEGVSKADGGVTINTTALSDPDTLFRERRDASGDPCFREGSWDSTPIEADFKIHLRPADACIDGRSFTGIRYWFEFGSESKRTPKHPPIHRIVDRQSWEVGGNLDDVTICLRNWLTPPRMRMKKSTTYSTVGLDKWAGLLPGNLWGRWTLLPSFDMQYGRGGVMLGWFDEVSLIRTVVETTKGEDALRVMDMHLFEQSHHVSTNPKTILYSPDKLDATDALNLWTRVMDLEHDKACDQFKIVNEDPPAIVFSENVWRNIRFDKTYEHVVNVASEFGADYVFIDPVWEHHEALRDWMEQTIPAEKRKGSIYEKAWEQNMCVTLDFEVAEVMGGEKGLKALCDRAAAKNIKLLSWMATHMSPSTILSQANSPLGKGMGVGGNGIFASKESGRHPDTGYAASCWPNNLNAPIYQRIRKQILGTCERTGLKGFLWDSFCNLGWWHVDYSAGDMRPQFEKMGELYADMVKAGLYVMPEAVVIFSNHSCCGLHGGNVYADDLLGYSYNTNISLLHEGGHVPGGAEGQILRGKKPIDELFRCVAHRRFPNMGLHHVPREQWNAQSAAEIKELFGVYKKHRHLMKRRTVLKSDRGVRWDADGDTALLYVFRESPSIAGAIDAATGETVSGSLQPNRAYLISAKA